MTEHDKINRQLARMEGECVHENEALYITCYWDSNAYYLTRECLDCDDNVAIVDAFRREATFMDARFPEWNTIPDRLSDPAYILGLVFSLLKDGRRFYYHEGRDVFVMSYTSNKVIEHQNERWAVALAAIQRWKEENV